MSFTNFCIWNLFFPTILDMIGADLRPDNHQDGVSLLPVLQGETIEERPLIWHYPHYGNQGGEPSSIIREGDWKLIYYHDTRTYELFDLANDLEEARNLAGQHPEIQQRLASKLGEYLANVHAQMPVRKETSKPVEYPGR